MNNLEKTCHHKSALGSDDSDAPIIRQAVSFARPEKARLTLIHVVDSVPTQIYDQDIYDEHTRNDENYLQGIADEIRDSGVPVEIELAFGNPTEELSKFTVSHKVDLLVMGSHGHRLVGDLIWGETVEPLRYKVKIPILVVR